jgi:hypothetical protein
MTMGSLAPGLHGSEGFAKDSPIAMVSRELRTLLKATKD